MIHFSKMKEILATRSFVSGCNQTNQGTRSLNMTICVEGYMCPFRGDLPSVDICVVGEGGKAGEEEYVQPS